MVSESDTERDKMEEKKITLGEVLKVMGDRETVELREENGDHIVSISSGNARKYLSEGTLEREIERIRGVAYGTVRVKLKTGEQSDD